MSKGFTTMSLKNDVLEMLVNLKVDFHGIEMHKNSDKIKALILMHKENLEKQKENS